MEENDLPSGWAYSDLRTIAAHFESGKRPKGGVSKYTVGVISLGGEHLRSDGTISIKSPRFVPEDFAQGLGRVRVRLNDILIVKDGATTGKTSIADSALIDAVINEHLFQLRPERGVEPKFLFQFLWSASGNAEIMKDFRGSAQGGITKSVLDVCRVPIAPFNEQQRIVEKIETLFAELDKGEEAVREVQNLLARYRQSVLKAAVSGDLTEDAPTSQEPVILGDLLEDIRYGTAKKCWSNAEGTAVLRIPNVVRGEIDLADLKFTELTAKERENLSLREGDILIVRSNGSANLVGRGAIVTSDASGMAYAGYLIRLRLNQNRITPAFLQIVLSSPVIRARIERQAKSTSGVHNLNSGEVKAIAFDLPNLETQERIVEAVEETLSRIAHGEAWCGAELKRSAALRQSILKNAFSGKLIRQDPSDEPAQKLLERIRTARGDKSEKAEKNAKPRKALA